MKVISNFLVHVLLSNMFFFVEDGDECDAASCPSTHSEMSSFEGTNIAGN